MAVRSPGPRCRRPRPRPGRPARTRHSSCTCRGRRSARGGRPWPSSRRMAGWSPRARTRTPISSGGFEAEQQLRGRHLLRVPAPPARADGPGRDAHVPDGQAKTFIRALPRLRRERTGRAWERAGQPASAARAVHSAEIAREAGRWVSPRSTSAIRQGERIMAPLRQLAPPAVDLLQPMPYTAFQAMTDAFAPTGWLNYHRGHPPDRLPDEGHRHVHRLRKRDRGRFEPEYAGDHLPARRRSQPRPATTRWPPGTATPSTWHTRSPAGRTPRRPRCTSTGFAAISEAMRPLLDRGRLPELRAGERRGEVRRLRRGQVRAARRAEEQVGPGEPVPGEPERPPERRGADLGPAAQGHRSGPRLRGEVSSAAEDGSGHP